MKTVKDYPTQVVYPTAEHIMWIFTGKWCIIDNFALTTVLVDIGHGMKEYPTSEHAFAAAKALYPTVAERIRKAKDPGTAKYMGRECTLRPEWEQVKFQVMWHVLKAKFAQHPQAVAKLLETGTRPIYEGNSWEDQVWGVTKVNNGCWKGRNALGEQLMEIRKELQ